MYGRLPMKVVRDDMLRGSRFIWPSLACFPWSLSRYGR